ncbi:MAG: hypothetical protein U0793_31770 [Gemmataceae bacterium]
MSHSLVLLSPYRYPGQYSLVLGPEDMAAWLNGFTLLWHPALLWQAQGPPRVDQSYDHENPQPGHIYAVPESPPLYLPDDWDERVKRAGAVAFRVGVSRDEGLARLREALKGEGRPGWTEGFALPEDKTIPFYAVGWGHTLLAALSEAMEHENLLETEKFWNDVQTAIARLAGFPEPASADTIARSPGEEPPGETTPEVNPADTSMSGGDFDEYGPPPDYVVADNPPGGEEARPDANVEPWYAALQQAGQRLLSAREVLYPVQINLLDLFLLDDRTWTQPWPAAFPAGVSCNVLVSGANLERLQREQPERFAELKERVQAGQVDICGGGYAEREEPFLPLDSQLWNLQYGREAVRRLLDFDVVVFARRRFGYHPLTPLLLTTSGFTKALFLTFDESAALPNYTSCVIGWPSPDGKQVDAFVRAGHNAADPQTYFNLGHYWFKTTREDHNATLLLTHVDQQACVWFRDLMELARLAPVLGAWNTFSRYLVDVYPGEHPGALAADEFHSDLLSERVTAHHPHPVSAFPEHQRFRRRLDACHTYAALHHSLGGTPHLLHVARQLQELEDAFETLSPAKAVAGAPELAAKVADLERSIAAGLAERLQSRAPENRPGYLVLNPCAFIRRVALELEPGAQPLPIGGPVKACQLDKEKLRVILEVPALGFAWIPREGPVGTAPMPSKIRVVDPQQLVLRNEFFEAEVDAATGGLKAIRDHKTHVNRLAQRLVFNPGSRMVAKDIQVTQSGPALAEIVSTGELLGEQDQLLARFTQRLRLWMSRPLLEMRITLRPEQPPAGYGWHAYFGSRFAWRDERAALLRSASGTGYLTTHPRPQTPDYLELRMGRQGTVILPGGLPFHQRHEGRMLDVILIPEGEQETTFDIGIALDREQPMQTALGLVSPVAVVPTTKGPPHIGDSGWLFHLDAPNLVMTRLTPGAVELPGYSSATTEQEPGAEPASEPAAKTAVTARLFECGGHSGMAELRCVRNPKRAVVLDGRGQFLLEAGISGDAVLLEVTPNDFVQVQVEF